MLEKPDIPDTRIIACLRDAYGLNVVRVTFLPLGADQHTAVYRAITDTATAYFVKLRRAGFFDEMSMVVPKFLSEQGVDPVIAPVSTPTQALWTGLGDFRLSVFPFVEGRNGYEVELSDQHWVDLGRALKGIHTAAIPPAIADRIQRETYSAQWREMVKEFLRLAARTSFRDAVAAELGAFLRHKRDEINKLVRRAEYLASILQTQSLRFVLCHADIHAANTLIDANDQLHIVDWDTLTLAAKERDLMFVGGGQFGNGRSAQEEEVAFYQGYGHTQADPIGLAYYRYERIVQDIAAYCEQILLTEGDGKDRANGLRQLMSQFEPNDVVEMAYRSEEKLPQEHKA